MVRLLVLDIDGTLLDPSDIVTPVVRAGIAEARSQGVEVALATGRRLHTTLPIVRELGISVPLVVYNGSLIWNTAEDRPMNELPFTPPMIEAVIQSSRAAGVAPVLLRGPRQGERLMMPEPISEQAMADISRYIRGPRLKETDRVPWTGLPGQPDVLGIDLFGEEDTLRSITRELSEVGLSTFHDGSGLWADIWAANIHMPGVSKASGVALLAADLGCTLADVVAVGDGDNDLPMLEAAGFGVAMGNAPEHVRERADAVVRGHDEDGVAEAIERFVLGRAG